MNISDFTFDHYGRLLDAALDAGYTFYTLEEYVRHTDHEDPHIVIRHDVDRKVSTARSMARVEAAREIPTSYYFRTSTFSPETVSEVAELGHEVGYHYEDYVKTRGDFEAAHERFTQNLARFREHVDVRTICPHGSPLSPYHNLDMWRGERTIEEYDLLAEAYLSVETASDDATKPSYVSDTGRDWGTTVGDFGRISTTDDLIAGLESEGCERLYLLVHPGRWSRNPAEHVQRVAWDVAAEAGKSTAQAVHSIGRTSSDRIARVMRERV
ncbi:hypothetical protein [Halalkalicoccus jeotgali]|uniref:Polysaccharide deacetylase n=1 Tax=Halalkalicoccus jeotgali (strain DSM 18796 / CECT 7217 / JCM 14584 / KCTC 4019 / B3) TaxID=795797 RepID=D8J728_HALJB|nr:hypothetical protein [Halalkalicoccus jeotgali]ADJ15981.1 hypothetical protein HacjB3_13000 [Halalkalicoccus jeotgali B3]ELY38077.1 hypothetical protein C497_08204 [Halalkalicoccus jeotgali B3]